MVIIMMALSIAYRIAPAEIKVIQDPKGTVTITDEYSPVKKARSRYRSVEPMASAFSPRVVPSKYLTKIKDLSLKYNLREDLIIAVARFESGFNPWAVSNKGAVGIMQLMAGTAMLYGVINRFNADQNLEAGVKHLKYLYELYNHDISLTLAAYNAGQEAVRKYNGIPPYSETRLYVKRIMGSLGLPVTTSAVVLPDKPPSKIYQYRNADGVLTISDTYPTHATSEVIVIE